MYIYHMYLYRVTSIGFFNQLHERTQFDILTFIKNFVRKIMTKNSSIVSEKGI